MPATVTTGRSAFFSACLYFTMRSVRPLARAVTTYSRDSSSTIDARVSRRRTAARAKPSATAGSTRCRRVPEPNRGNTVHLHREQEQQQDAEPEAGHGHADLREEHAEVVPDGPAPDRRDDAERDGQHQGDRPCPSRARAEGEREALDDHLRDGLPVDSEVPKSNRTTLASHRRYWTAQRLVGADPRPDGGDALGRRVQAGDDERGVARDHPDDEEDDRGDQQDGEEESAEPLQRECQQSHAWCHPGGCRHSTWPGWKCKPVRLRPLPSPA